MRSSEPKVGMKSDYYTYQPSATATKIFLYPIAVGYFYYEPGYYLRRNSYDSFLLMYIAKGSLKLKFEGLTATASKNQFILLDCYRPHEYGNDDAAEICWLHFDGLLARNYYDLITSAHGNIISPENPQAILDTMEEILSVYRDSSPVKESVVSGHLTQALTELLNTRSDSGNKFSHSKVVGNSLAYINEHFREPISLKDIAKNANLSPYHFSRIFTAETGYTPHQYLIATRISSAKFQLQIAGGMPVKEIAFATGFNSESSFCSTFKKWEGLTPSEYRTKSLAN